MTKTETIPIDKIQFGTDTQIRSQPDETAVIRYAEAMKEAGTNEIFPPIIVFQDDEGLLWLADGHHRVSASIRNEFDTIQAEVRSGTKSDAIQAAIEANKRNGVPLSKSDRHKAMGMILENQPDITDGELAEMLGVNRTTILRWREDSRGVQMHTSTPRIGKDGRTYQAKQKKKPRKSHRPPGIRSQVIKTMPPVAMPKPPPAHVLPSYHPTPEPVMPWKPTYHPDDVGETDRDVLFCKSYLRQEVDKLRPVLEELLRRVGRERFDECIDKIFKIEMEEDNA